MRAELAVASTGRLMRQGTVERPWRCPGAWPAAGERLIVDASKGSRLPCYRGRSCQADQPCPVPMPARRPSLVLLDVGVGRGQPGLSLLPGQRDPPDRGGAESAPPRPGPYRSWAGTYPGRDRARYGRRPARPGLLDAALYHPWRGCRCSRDTGAAIRQAGFKIEQEARIAVREAQLGLSVQHILGIARRD